MVAELAASVGFNVVGVAKREIVRGARMMPVSHKSSRTGIEARMHEEGVIGLIKPVWQIYGGVTDELASLRDLTELFSFFP